MRQHEGLQRAAAGLLPSVDTSKPAIRGQVKTGQMGAGAQGRMCCSAFLPEEQAA
jgi:hypothetical protein